MFAPKVNQHLERGMETVGQHCQLEEGVALPWTQLRETEVQDGVEGIPFVSCIMLRVRSVPQAFSEIAPGIDRRVSLDYGHGSNNRQSQRQKTTVSCDLNQNVGFGYFSGVLLPIPHAWWVADCLTRSTLQT